MTAKEGTKVFLTTVVEGATEFTWQYWNPSIGRWADMLDTNGVSGSKWSELSIVVSDIWARYQYHLVASNEGGKTISDIVTITIPATPTPVPTATPIPTPDVVALLDAKFSVGNYVTFGTYPQTSSGNGNTPIEWVVLARAGQKALLLSRYGLDAQPYNTEWSEITWEKCTLRGWLNATFLNKAFTAHEQTGIELTNVDNSSSQGYSSWSASGGNNTLDKIFLLSYAEANKYLGITYDDSNNTKSRVAPTAYAIKQRAYTSSSNKTAEGAATGWWWLRSPGAYQNEAAIVFSDGSLSYSDVHYASGCVRPALWVNLESGIF